MKQSIRRIRWILGLLTLGIILSFIIYSGINNRGGFFPSIVEKFERQLDQASDKIFTEMHSSMQLQEELYESYSHKDIIHCSSLLSIDPYKKDYLPQLLGPDFVPKGILNSVGVCKPNNLHPFNGFIAIRELYDDCVPRLTCTHVGNGNKKAPNLAICIEEVIPDDHLGCVEFWVYLRKDVYWSPLIPELFPKNIKLDGHFLKKHSVTAHDFKFHYDAVMNPYFKGMQADSLKSVYADIIDFQVVDDFTFFVRWKAREIQNEELEKEIKLSYFSRDAMFNMRPLPCFVYQYFPDGEKIIDEDNDPDIYRSHSEWARNFWCHWAMNYIVSCGPMIFSSMDDSRISLVRKRDYFDPYASLIQKKNIYLKDNIESGFQAFKTGMVNICIEPASQAGKIEEFMQSQEYARQKALGEEIKTIVSQDNKYMYIAWNCQSKYFSNKEVRQAICMAIDKKLIVDQLLNGAASLVTGPFSLGSHAYDSSIKDWAFNQEKAQTLLEKHGWIDVKGNGIRYKKIHGQWEPFRFKIYYYAKNFYMKSICDYISNALRNIGIDCQPFGLDMADLSKHWDERDFEAMFMCSQANDRIPNPRPLWYSSSGENQSCSDNAMGFSSKTVDQLIDLLTYESDVHKREKLYHAIHRAIHEEAPCLFLFTRKIKTCYRSPIQNLFIPSHQTKILPGSKDPHLYKEALYIR